MDIYRLGNMTNHQERLRALGVESGGVSIMSNKMELLYFYLKDLKTPAANILKQDALSIGADLAVPSGVITCEKSSYDCILIGTKKHIEILSRKEMAQPFGLKAVAKELKRALLVKHYPTKIMGIINANDDSFYDNSRFSAKTAILEIEKMIDSGASYIDIGAVSSRPGASTVSTKEELERIKPICDVIKSKELHTKAMLSIDSYRPEVIEYALECGFGLINDITGAQDDKVIALALKYGAKLCIMHKQGTPETMQNSPQYGDIMVDVSKFFEERISKCEDMGLMRDQIILDVGIGFGKNLEHNVTLIENLSHFQKFGCEILVGASRKSIIDMITPTPINERLPGTLAIHLKAIQNGASIIRCHDVAEHQQALAVWDAVNP